LESSHIDRQHDAGAPGEGALPFAGRLPLPFSGSALPFDESPLPPLPPLGRVLNVLLVWPRFSDSFWSLSGIMELLPQECSHPPLGLITVAALCPAHWTLRLIDLSLQALTDEDLAAADLVMVSGMRVQRDDMLDVLARARRLGTRTILGGPYASSQPDVLQPFADHVVVGEPDEVFGDIARDLEQGTARRRYVISDKPDVTRSPVPRFDLLDRRKYLSMAVQFSRGCPFQCEFCDIITIYGRKPRMKTPDQVIAECDALRRLGWRGRVFVVDDNFIGNHKHALTLADRMAEWQQEHGYPISFTTEASMDLAQHPRLIEAMVRANFWSVFVGIESPSRESLTQIKKFQNLRNDPLECIRTIQRGGLWVTGGFIVGFDADTDDIFDRQVEFIERAAVVCAMTGFLEALPTTPLYDRLQREGRLIDDARPRGIHKPPNFRTRMPLRTLLAGNRRILSTIYAPSTYFDRAARSLEDWTASEHHHMPRINVAVVLARSFVKQGIASSYRRDYWKFLFGMIKRWRGQPKKMWLGFSMLIAAHHFLRYAQKVSEELDHEIQQLDAVGDAATTLPAGVA
jgi:radical SAM superfamily enzyme YgiQ (UPF0313 family)